MKTQTVNTFECGDVIVGTHSFGNTVWVRFADTGDCWVNISDGEGKFKCADRHMTANLESTVGVNWDYRANVFGMLGLNVPV